MRGLATVYNSVGKVVQEFYTDIEDKYSFMAEEILAERAAHALKIPKNAEISYYVMKEV